MARYAEAECADCHIILPKNEMKAVQSRVMTGESVNRSTRTYSRGASSSNRGITTHYRYRTIMLCQPCAEARFRAFVKLCIAGAVVALVALAMVMFRSGDEHHSDTAAGFSSTATPGEAVKQTDSAPTSAEPQSHGNAVATDAPTEGTAPPPDESASSDDETQTSANGPSVSAAIAAATQTALTNERPERWVAADGSGYVVPGQPQSYPGRQCNEVYTTTTGPNGQQWKSESQHWCRAVGSTEWSQASGEE